MLNFSEKPSPSTNPGTEGQNGTIILCDDNSLVLKTTSLILKTCLSSIGDYTLEKFKNGQLVLDFIRNKTRESLISFIISDLDMPGTSGIQLAKTLRGEIKDQITPFVLISGDSTQELRIEKLIEEGYIDAFVAKPFTAESLRNGVKKAMDTRLKRIQDTEAK